MRITHCGAGGVPDLEITEPEFVDAWEEMVAGSCADLLSSEFSQPF